MRGPLHHLTRRANHHVGPIELDVVARVGDELVPAVRDSRRLIVVQGREHRGAARPVRASGPSTQRAGGCSLPAVSTTSGRSPRSRIARAAASIAGIASVSFASPRPRGGGTRAPRAASRPATRSVSLRPAAVARVPSTRAPRRASPGPAVAPATCRRSPKARELIGVRRVDEYESLHLGRIRMGVPHDVRSADRMANHHLRRALARGRERGVQITRYGREVERRVRRIAPHDAGAAVGTDPRGARRSNPAPPPSSASRGCRAPTRGPRSASPHRDSRSGCGVRRPRRRAGRDGIRLKRMAPHQLLVARSREQRDRDERRDPDRDALDPARGTRAHRPTLAPNRTITRCVALSSGVTAICASGRSVMLPGAR